MSKRIKILYTIPNFDTAGSGKVVYDLVMHIDKTKFEPHIACNHNRGDFFKKVNALGVPIHIFEVSATYRPFWKLPWKVLKIARFFKKQQFDVIHSWHWSSDVSEPLAAKLAGIPFVYTKKAMGWGNKAWLWRSKLSTHIISVNQEMRDQFFSLMLYKVSNIPIGLDTKIYKPLQKSFKSPNGIETKPTDVVIVSVANLVPVKGIELLLEATQGLNNPKVKVFIVGDDRSEYAQRLKNTYASEQIYFTGKVTDVRPYLALSDLFVICTLSIGEGQPMAPIEAMLSERIVIGSDVTGIRDILIPFQNCIFKAGSEEAIKDKLQMIMYMSKTERFKLATNMSKFAKEKYALTQSIKMHEQLYKSFVS